MKKKFDAFKSDEEGYVKKKEYILLQQRLQENEAALEKTNKDLVTWKSYTG